MYCDAQNTFSKKQAVTVSAQSDDVVDVGKDGLGDTDITIETIVDEDVAADGAALVSFAVMGADQSDLSDGEELYVSAQIAKADLAAGAVAVRQRMGYINKRYLYMRYIVTTGPLTAGKFTSRMLPNVQTNR